MSTPAPTVWPALRCRDPRALIDFLVSVCGFTETVVHTGDAGQVVHAELAGPAGGGVMLGQAPAPDCAAADGDDWPLEPGASGAYVVVDDAARIDAIGARAVGAGGTILRAPHDTDHGSHDVALRDPEGNRWRFGTYPGHPATGPSR